MKDGGFNIPHGRRGQLRPTVKEMPAVTEETGIPKPTPEQLRMSKERTELIPENQPTSLTEKFLWGTAGFLVVIGVVYAISHYVFG